MRLTLREELNLGTVPHVELLQGGQMPKAFGHQISKIRN